MTYKGMTITDNDDPSCSLELFDNTPDYAFHAVLRDAMANGQMPFHETATRECTEAEAIAKVDTYNDHQREIYATFKSIARIFIAMFGVPGTPSDVRLQAPETMQ